MPHISRRKLKRKVFLKIHAQLFQALRRTENGEKQKKFVEELLTPTERIMIAKRLAVIVMLGKGFTLPEIVKTVKVSPSTVERIGGEFDSSYRYIGRQFSRTHGKGDDFWSALEKLILMGMPPRVGRGRWDFLHR